MFIYVSYIVSIIQGCGIVATIALEILVGAPLQSKARLTAWIVRPQSPRVFAGLCAVQQLSFYLEGLTNFSGGFIRNMK